MLVKVTLIRRKLKTTEDPLPEHFCPGLCNRVKAFRGLLHNGLFKTLRQVMRSGRVSALVSFSKGTQKVPKGFHTLQPRSALKLKAVGSPCWATRSVGRATICQCTPKNKVIDHGSTFQGWVAGSKYLYHRDPPETGDLHCF